MEVPREIPTDRLLLRRHIAADLEPFLEFLNHPTATRDMAFTPEQKSRDGAKGMLDYVIASYDSPAPVFSLTIVDPQTGLYLGSCGLNPMTQAGDVEIYYTVMPAYQRNGFATEASAALLDHLWKTTSTKRVFAFVVPTNVASVQVARKLGFVDDGPVHRDAQSGELPHAEKTGRRYVLVRSKA